MGERIIREYVFTENKAKIRVCIQEHQEDCFVLSLVRSPHTDIAVAMRPDEALLVAAMLTQAVVMSCEAYNVDIGTTADHEYGNFTPQIGEMGRRKRKTNKGKS